MWLSDIRCRTFITRKCTEDFTDSKKKEEKKKKKEMVDLEVARLVGDEENDCRFEVQMEERWIHTRPTRSTVIRERFQKLFCD